MRDDVGTPLKSIFPTYIVEVDLSPSIQDILEEYYTPHIPDQESSQRFNQKTDYESDKNYDIHPSLRGVIAQLASELTGTIRSEPSDYCPDDCNIAYWIQDYDKGQYHGVHNHPGWTLSGIYVLRSNDLGEPLMLVHPDPVRRHISSYNTLIELPPTRGRLYMWPSWIDHFVQPQKDENVIRTTLVFNIE